MRPTFLRLVERAIHRGIVTDHDPRERGGIQNLLQGLTVLVSIVEGLQIAKLTDVRPGNWTKAHPLYRANSRDFSSGVPFVIIEVEDILIEEVTPSG